MSLALTGKPGDTFDIANGLIILTVVKCENNQVRFAFDAPPDIIIDRGKIALDKRENGPR